LGSICLDACPGAPLNSSAVNKSSTTDLNTVYCVCNNALTFGRTETGVEDSLKMPADKTTPNFLALDCLSSKCANANCKGKGKNWVRYDNPSEIELTGQSVEQGLY